MYDPNLFNPAMQGVGNSFPGSSYVNQNPQGMGNSYPSANMSGAMSMQNMPGMSNFPQSMSQGMMKPLPSLYPNVNYGQMSPPQPYPNLNQQQQQFAKGGRVRRKFRNVGDLQNIGQALSQLGERNDSLLAHINPEEARFLAHNFGGDVNPETGLPQYGLNDERAAMAKAEAFYKNYEPLLDLAHERNYFGGQGNRMPISAPMTSPAPSSTPAPTFTQASAASVQHGSPPQHIPVPHQNPRSPAQFIPYTPPAGETALEEALRLERMRNAMAAERARHGHAAGGHIKETDNDIPSLAGYLSTLGVGDDKILAHINPEEARILQERFGGDINPETGLPQYGLFKGIGKIFKKALPIIGTAVGTYFGGPVGGTIGGAIGGGISGGKKGAISGAGIGALGSYLGPVAGNAFGVNPTGVMGKSLNMGGEGLFGSLGLGNMLGGNAANAVAVPGAEALGGKAVEAVASKGSSGGIGGLLSGLLGDKADLKSLATLAVAAGMLGGKDKGKFKKVGPNGEPYEKPYEPPASEWAGRNYQYPQLAQAESQAEPDNYRYNKPRVAKKGGYISGDTDGQADKIKALLSDGEFVIPADVVSDLGNGNNNAGGKSLASFIGNVRKHKHKSVKGLPPKAKPIGEYLGRRRNA